ncbi:MAG: FlgD Ig-like domain [Thermoleophilia bacterium]|nr:FlgD Ig-like domain [Thermoleophilia bacterium]
MMIVLALPGTAHAARCKALLRADAAAGAVLVNDLRARGNAGAEDAAAMLKRARPGCRALPFARAVAAAYQGRGVPTLSQHTRVRGYELVGVQVGASVVWRADPTRQARGVVGAKSAPINARARLRLLTMAAVTRGMVVWSRDPTRPAWDAELQSSVVDVLRRGRAGDRAVASASVRAAGATARQRSISRLPAATALLVAARLERAASDRRARIAARTTTLRAFARLRGATQRGWSRSSPTTWSTLAEHKLLLGRGRALLARVPHATTRRALDRLAAALTTPPLVRFAKLPGTPFYPWPRDGAFDADAIQLSLDKPASLQFTVFGADDTPIRQVALDAVPGYVDLAWDGASADGTIQPAGEYRYAVTATDFAGNQQLVAGLQSFVVARDTTPPSGGSGSVRHVSSKEGRRLVITWKVEEVHSPKVRTFLMLSKAGSRQSILIDEERQQGTVRRPTTLSSGTWNARFVFIDGSGNRMNLTADSFVVR